MNTKYVHRRSSQGENREHDVFLVDFACFNPRLISCFEFERRVVRIGIYYYHRTRFEKDTDELSRKRHPSFRGGFWEERRGCESRQRVRFQNQSLPFVENAGTRISCT